MDRQSAWLMGAGDKIFEVSNPRLVDTTGILVVSSIIAFLLWVSFIL
jgi:hypothetical protein